MQLLYGENGRSELARDMRMSHSLISQMLRGEKPVSNKFLVRLMGEMEDILFAQAAELYHARELVLQLGRSVVPSFDLPYIQSNAEYAEMLRQVQLDAAAAELENLGDTDPLLEEMERYQAAPTPKSP
jgi:transcriptional regulator with XRE-family HTH domain